LIVLIASGENALYLVNYENCTGMVKIELDMFDMFVNENLIFSNLTMIDISPHSKEVQKKQFGKSLDADALVYITLDNGCVLTGLIQITRSGKPDDSFSCQWVPQHLFNVDQS